LILQRNRVKILYILALIQSAKDLFVSPIIKI